VSMSVPDMRQFWDQRADEDAFFFVDNRLQYRAPDLERFWSEGQRDLDHLLGALQAELYDRDHVLEIGCGVGRLTRVLAERAASVTALDVSPRMLELAREHNGNFTNVKWLLGDGATLSGVPSASVDCCVSHVVFQHIPDPEITLSYVREMGRVLRPRAWSAFQISNDPRVHQTAKARQRLQSAVRAAGGLGPGGQNDSRWRGSMVTLDALHEAAGQAALDVERVVGEGTQFCLVLLRHQ
jgi:SAM-dependent methyltransferase